MRALAVLLLAAGCHRGLVSAGGDDAPPPVPPSPLAAGDIIDIASWRRGELGTFVVSADGTVDVPGIGSAVAAGLTPDQLARELEARGGDDERVRVLVASSAAGSRR